MNIIQAVIYFLIGFLIVNGIKALQFQKSKKKIISQQKTDLTSQDLNERALRRILPYTPAYYLTIWVTCSSFYFANHTSEFLFYDGLSTGITWLVLSIIFETATWVLLKHKLNISMQQMYLTSQPWVSLSFYIILVSPLILAFVKM